MNPPELNPMPAATAALWQQRYEALRQLAVTGNRVLAGEPLGLVLLLREGVAGWMRHWSGLGEPTPGAPGPPLPTVPSTPQWQQQLTELLAQMSLVHLPDAPIF